jgi:hypothetical protein
LTQASSTLDPDALNEHFNRLVAAALIPPALRQQIAKGLTAVRTATTADEKRTAREAMLNDLRLSLTRPFAWPGACVSRGSWLSHPVSPRLPTASRLACGSHCSSSSLWALSPQSRSFSCTDERRPPVWTVRIDQGPLTMVATFKDQVEVIDPASLVSLYELLKSLEPAIGYLAFVKSRFAQSRTQ